MTPWVSWLLAVCSCLALGGAEEGCNWKMKDSPLPQPLYISNWTQVDDSALNISNFLLPHLGKMHVTEGSEILFACPGTKLKPFSSKISAMILRCEGNKWREHDGSKSYHLEDLKCLIPINTINNYEGKACTQGGHENEELMQVGYSVQDEFYQLSATCFNKHDLEVQYSQYMITPSVKVNIKDLKPHTKSTSWFSKDESFDLGYERKVPETNNARKSPNFWLSKGHYQKTADLLDGAHLDATFFYLTSLPSWFEPKKENWDELEDRVRSFSAHYNRELQVFVGVYGKMKITPKIKNRVPFHLRDNDKYVIPQKFWKVVYDPNLKKGVAFAFENDLNVKDATEMQSLCSDVCDQLTHWRLHDWLKNELDKGPATCCLVQDLRNKFQNIPDLNLKGGLLN